LLVPNLSSDTLEHTVLVQFKLFPAHFLLIQRPSTRHEFFRVPATDAFLVGSLLFPTDVVHQRHTALRSIWIMVSNYCGSRLVGGIWMRVGTCTRHWLFTRTDARPIRSFGRLDCTLCASHLWLLVEECTTGTPLSSAMETGTVSGRGGYSVSLTLTLSFWKSYRYSSYLSTRGTAKQIRRHDGGIVDGTRESRHQRLVCHQRLDPRRCARSIAGCCFADRH
jgi:hypothetical protein